VLDLFGVWPFEVFELAALGVVLLACAAVVGWEAWRRRRQARCEAAEAARRMDARMQAVRALVEADFARFRKAKRR